MPQPGQDARLYARKALDYGDGMTVRFTQARSAYERLRADYAAPAQEE